MRFSKLDVNGVKGVAKAVDLHPVTIVTGENASGKSALLEAIRLSVTGRAEIGGSGKLISRIVSGRHASAVLYGPTPQSWSCSIEGDKVSQKASKEDTQGGIPISIDEWDGLTASQKFALVAGDNICDVVGRIEEAKHKRKELDAVVKRPVPIMPDPYDGDALHVMEGRLGEISLELARNKESSQNYQQRILAREREEDRLAEAKSNLSVQTLIVQKTSKELREATAELNLVADLVDRYEAAIKDEPKLISWARKHGMDSKGMLMHFISGIREACDWLSGPLSLASEEMQWLSDDMAEITIHNTVKIPDPKFDRCTELYQRTSQPHEHLASLKEAVAKLEKDGAFAQHKYEVMQRDVNRIEQSLATELAIYGEPLAPEVLSELMDEKVTLEECIAKCKRWEEYDRLCGDDIVARTRAAEEMDVVDDLLTKLTMERAAIVSRVTGPIEEHANKTLERAGLVGLSVGVEATAKQAQLVVVTGDGIHVDALAKSQRLAYSIALLSAIQQTSNAVCPVLVAQCAEMDAKRFASFAQALAPDKGNIILEHHINPGLECMVIM